MTCRSPAIPNRCTGRVPNETTRYEPVRRDRVPYDRVPYDPWCDLNQNWPHVALVVEPMSGDLLGEVRSNGSVIALRAGTSSAQRRCTLTHEIVHLERGLPTDESWLYREERLVHRETARRLVPLAELAAAIREAGGDHDRAALAQSLDVDRDTLDVRMADLEPGERRWIRRRLRRHYG